MPRRAVLLCAGLRPEEEALLEGARAQRPRHPSGDPAPSLEDRRVTVRLREAGELVGIRVVDHVIVAEGGYHSFEEEGELS